ncbi:MAG TPA: response regulator [Blastocatellia bacterium]|nr:response regulator [Blastocatellia bacterium]
MNACLNFGEYHKVRLVLTDMMMPVMDGPGMIRALRRLNPQLAIIGSNGLAEEQKAGEARQLGVSLILMKPYNAETLLKAIARILHSEPEQVSDSADCPEHRHSEHTA